MWSRHPAENREDVDIMKLTMNNQKNNKPELFNRQRINTVEPLP